MRIFAWIIVFLYMQILFAAETIYPRGLDVFTNESYIYTGAIDLNKMTKKIKAVYPLLMTIPHTFKFHTKLKHKFEVDLYVLEGKR